MSLDVYLKSKSPVPSTGSGIFVRMDGETREITREVWDHLNPGREPVVILQEAQTTEVYTSNITHNLGTMAEAAGLYDPLWSPDEHGYTLAKDLIKPLSAGLERLRADPAKFKAFNPRNGWGDYHGLIRFVENYLAACREFPDAEVSVWK